MTEIGWPWGAAATSRKRTVDYCRFVVSLPTNSSKSIAASRQSLVAAARVIDALSRQYKGSTYTNISHSPFNGFWLDTEAVPAVPYPATVALLIIDAPFSIADEPRIEAALTAIRACVFAEYAAAFVPQIEVWASVQAIKIRKFEKIIRSQEELDKAE